MLHPRDIVNSFWLRALRDLYHQQQVLLADAANAAKIPKDIWLPTNNSPEPDFNSSNISLGAWADTSRMPATCEDIKIGAQINTAPHSSCSIKCSATSKLIPCTFLQSDRLAHSRENCSGPRITCSCTLPFTLKANTPQDSAKQNEVVASLILLTYLPRLPTPIQWHMAKEAIEPRDASGI
jgi:hypothetical protein